MLSLLRTVAGVAVMPEIDNGKVGGHDEQGPNKISGWILRVYYGTRHLPFKCAEHGRCL